MHLPHEERYLPDEAADDGWRVADEGDGPCPRCGRYDCECPDTPDLPA